MRAQTNNVIEQLIDGIDLFLRFFMQSVIMKPVLLKIKMYEDYELNWFHAFQSSLYLILRKFSTIHNSTRNEGNVGFCVPLTVVYIKCSERREMFEQISDMLKTGCLF